MKNRHFSPRGAWVALCIATIVPAVILMATIKPDDAPQWVSTLILFLLVPTAITLVAGFFVIVINVFLSLVFPRNP